jgi:hypothetical protein
MKICFKCGEVKRLCECGKKRNKRTKKRQKRNKNINSKNGI